MGGPSPSMRLRMTGHWAGSWRPAGRVARSNRRGPSEQVSLHFLTFLFAQELHLRFRLHPFGGHGQVQAVGHGDDCGDDGAVAAALVDLGDELAVDLHPVDGEVAEVAERGVAGAEVVEGDADAEVAELHERGN